MCFSGVNGYRHGFTSDAKEIGERLFGQAQFAAMQSPQAKRFQNLIGEVTCVG